MSSKAFFNSSVKPRLVHAFTRGLRSIEVWTTTCIVTNFGKTTDANCSVLLNPSNPELSGVSNFPYFPRGGPVPDKPVHSSMHKDWQPLGFVSTWGGMEVGDGMMYPVSVVDGLVHQLGGWSLQAELAMLKTKTRLLSSSHLPCPMGTAVRTSAGKRGGSLLSEHYDAIVHTTPPFFKFEDDPSTKLLQCYQSALALAFCPQSSFNEPTATSTTTRVATPLLGAGARGFPYDIAMEVAVQASAQWCRLAGAVEDKEEFPPRIALVFGLLEDSIAERLVEKLEHAMKP